MQYTFNTPMYRKSTKPKYTAALRAHLSTTLTVAVSCGANGRAISHQLV